MILWAAVSMVEAALQQNFAWWRFYEKVHRPNAVHPTLLQFVIADFSFTMNDFTYYSVQLCIFQVQYLSLQAPNYEFAVKTCKTIYKISL